MEPPAPVIITTLPRRKPTAAAESIRRTRRSRSSVSLTRDAESQLHAMRQSTTPSVPRTKNISVTE